MALAELEKTRRVGRTASRPRATKVLVSGFVPSTGRATEWLSTRGALKVCASCASFQKDPSVAVLDSGLCLEMAEGETAVAPRPNGEIPRVPNCTVETAKARLNDTILVWHNAASRKKNTMWSAAAPAAFLPDWEASGLILEPESPITRSPGLPARAFGALGGHPPSAVSEARRINPRGKSSFAETQTRVAVETDSCEVCRYHSTVLLRPSSNPTSGV